MNNENEVVCRSFLADQYTDLQLYCVHKDWWVVKVGHYNLGVGSTSLGALRHAADRTMKFGAQYWREIADKLTRKEKVA